MVKTAQCSSVSGAYASWACTSMVMHLTGGTAQKVDTNELDSRRVGFRVRQDRSHAWGLGFLGGRFLGEGPCSAVPLARKCAESAKLTQAVSQSATTPLSSLRSPFPSPSRLQMPRKNSPYPFIEASLGPHT